MSVNLLAINVGNTRTQLGVYMDGELEDQRRVSNDDLSDLGAIASGLYASIADLENPAVYLASVNDEAAGRVSDAVGERVEAAIERAGDDFAIPIGHQLDPEALIGDDRLLNAAAAYEKIKEAVIVVDAGTAVTVDFVDGEGTFHGGAILPGCQMQLDALADRTAQLPRVAFTRPDEVIGHSTSQAMLTGVFFGVRGAVRELIERYAELYNAWPKVVATGGDALTLFEGYDLIEALVEDLTLRGLAASRRVVLKGGE
ncbi:MAG: type III pantothenate kinase [Planctomycetota bacterium]|jgi:type III pantothenate kinase